MSNKWNNSFIRIRDQACIVSTVAPPFTTAFWPNVQAITAELGIPRLSTSRLEDSGEQAKFLSALAESSPDMAIFKPIEIGFAWSKKEIKERQRFLENEWFITFSGHCSSCIVLSTIELLQRFKWKPVLHLSFKGWDPFADWLESMELFSTLLSFGHWSKGTRVFLSLESQLDSIPPGLWEFFYDYPRVRLFWTATEAASCETLEEFVDASQEPRVRNAASIARIGIILNTKLPTNNRNLPILSDEVLALSDITRGGPVDISPDLPDQVRSNADISLDDYVGAIMKLYEDRRVSLPTVSPYSWVVTRLSSKWPLLPMPADLGATILVSPDGNVFAGEFTHDSSTWFVGNLLQKERRFRWDVVEAMQEMLTGSRKPEACIDCVWRFRCGGQYSPLPPPIPRSEAEEELIATRFRFYCAPRNRLFESALWDSIKTSVRDRTKTERCYARRGRLQFFHGAEPEPKI